MKGVIANQTQATSFVVVGCIGGHLRTEDRAAFI